MKIFTCQACGQLVYFENTSCEKCTRRLGYLPKQAELSALEPDGASWCALAVDEVRIRHLRLGDASVDLLLHRHASDVAVNVIERTGDIRIVVVN